MSSRPAFLNRFTLATQQICLPPDGLQFTSPYLSVGVLPDEQYIYYNNRVKVRGRMEHSFFQIGTAVMAGGALGGLRGFYEAHQVAKGQPTPLYRLMVLNQMAKTIPFGNTLGILALMYAGFGIGIAEIRGRDDQANSVLAATATGYLYKCTSGFRSMIYGGGGGLCLGIAIALWSGKGELWDEWNSIARKFITDWTKKDVE